MSLQFLTTSCWHGGGLQLGDRATPLVVGLKRQCSRFSWRRGKRGSTGRPSSCRRSGTQAAVLARRRSFLYSAWPDSAGWPSLHVSTLTLRWESRIVRQAGPAGLFAEAAEHWRQTGFESIMVALRKRAPCGSFGGNAGLGCRRSEIRWESQ